MKETEGIEFFGKGFIPNPRKSFMEDDELVRIWETKIWKDAWKETLIKMKTMRIRSEKEGKPIMTKQQQCEELRLVKEKVEDACEQVLSLLKPDFYLQKEMIYLITFLKVKISYYYSLLLKSDISSKKAIGISKGLIEDQAALYTLFKIISKIQKKEIEILQKQIKRFDSKYGTQA